ncbi:MAG: RDD family protein [Gemmatimonadaceae bacterium]
MNDSVKPSGTPTQTHFPTLWYTVENGGRRGPWSLEQLKARLSAGEVELDTLCWSEGLPDWIRLGDLDLSEGRPNPTEKVQSLSEPGSAESVSNPKVSPEKFDDSPHPWPRWLARILDFYLTAFAAGIVSAFVNPGFFSSENTFVTSFWVVVIHHFLVEPISFALGGRTIGKALLNIAIATTEGDSLDFSQSLRRSTNVWIKGMGLGIPLVSLFTVLHQYQELTKKGVTSYDRGESYKVTHGKISGIRAALLVFVVLVCVAISVIGSSSK